MKKIITFGIVFILLSFNILGLTLQFTEDESDPIYSSVADELITNATNGNIAYGWGDHSLVGYLTSESDPIYLSVADELIYNASHGETAYSWGNHATAGYLLDSGDTATGDYNFDSGTLIIDSGNNRVGIGDTTPEYVLDIENSAPIISLKDTDTSAKHLISGSSYSGNLYLYADTNSVSTGNIELFSHGNRIATFKANGNVGIGTETPQNKLDIKSGSVCIHCDGETASNLLRVGRYWWDEADMEHTGIDIYGEFSNKYEDRSRIITFHGGNGVSMWNETNTSTGDSHKDWYLGIKSLDQPYFNQGQFFIQRDGNEYVNIDYYGNTVINEGGSDSDFRVESDTNTHALFMRGSDGYVGIGTSAPTTNLEINSGDSDAIIYIKSSDNPTSPRVAKIKFSSNWGGSSPEPSYIDYDYFGTDHGGGFTSHGLNYVSGRNGFSNHWFLEKDGTLQMVIKDGGNVGIGTQHPNSTLEVIGDLRVDGNINYTGTLQAESPLMFGKDGETHYTTWCVWDKKGFQDLIYFENGEQKIETNSKYCKAKQEKNDFLESLRKQNKTIQTLITIENTTSYIYNWKTGKDKNVTTTKTDTKTAHRQITSRDIVKDPFTGKWKIKEPVNYKTDKEYHKVIVTTTISTTSTSTSTTTTLKYDPKEEEEYWKEWLATSTTTTNKIDLDITTTTKKTTTTTLWGDIFG